MNKRLVEEIFIALSLSNLLFIAGWRRVIYPNSEAYHIKLEPYPLDYIGILLSVLLVAGIFLGGLFLSRYLNKEKTPIISKLFFLGVFAVVLNGIRLQFFESESGIFFKIGLFAITFLIGILVLLKWRNHIFPFIRSLVLILSPFVLFTFSQAMTGIFTANPVKETPIKNQLSVLRPKEKPEIKNRVIWIIFDELDYFVPFGISPPIVDLPEFTRLKKESLFATNATSPAYATRDSIPSLLTGKIIKKSSTAGKNELVLNFADEETDAKFSEVPNIFRKTKEMDGETAVIGWYHSYCRTIGKDLSACQWESFDTINDFEKQPLSKIMLRNFTSCLISLPFGYRIFEKVNLKLEANFEDTGYIKRHYRMLEDSNEVISNPNIDLALIHLTFPHAPGYFNQKTGEFGAASGYLDNLALSDKVLGELRQTLETNNLWDNSTIIVSSDHQWRLKQYKLKDSDKDFAITQGVEHPNIPFILKLKSQKESVIYDKSFNTVITHDLILAIMKGDVSRVEEVKNWLDKNAK